jgi:hypothetical protein
MIKELSQLLKNEKRPQLLIFKQLPRLLSDGTTEKWSSCRSYYLYLLKKMNITWGDLHLRWSGSSC